MTLTFTVPGVPRPQGSKRHVGGGRMVESSKHLPAWRSLAVDTIHAARKRTDGLTFTSPVCVTAAFYFPRPKSHYAAKGALRASAPRHMAKRPDLEKLERALADALQIAGALVDDAQIVGYLTFKCYVDDEVPEPCSQVEVIGL